MAAFNPTNIVPDLTQIAAKLLGNECEPGEFVLRGIRGIVRLLQSASRARSTVIRTANFPRGLCIAREVHVNNLGGISGTISSSATITLTGDRKASRLDVASPAMMNAFTCFTFCALQPLQR